MNAGDHTDSEQSTDLRSADSQTNFSVEPMRYAEAYVSGDGRLRMVADPFGEWIEADGDALMEVRA